MCLQSSSAVVNQIVKTDRGQTLKQENRTVPVLLGLDYSAYPRINMSNSSPLFKKIFEDLVMDVFYKATMDSFDENDFHGRIPKVSRYG